jgi:hypothetical protein
MRVTHDLNSFGEIIAHAHCSVDEQNVGCKEKYITCVPHKNNCTNKKKKGSHDLKQTDSSIIIVRAYLSNDCLSFRHEVMIGKHRNKSTES